MFCPKCRVACPDGSETCPGCGLVFARYDPLAQVRLRQQRGQARADAAKARQTLGILVLGALAIAALALWWSGRTPAQAFTAPTGGGRIFAGLAHDFDASDAELYLVNGGQTVRRIGRIGADGRFRFELPAELELPRLDRGRERRLQDMGEGTGETNERVRDDIARWASQPQSAVHALNAGEGWSGLKVEPLELNAARYAVGYANDSTHGDLFAANGGMDRMAMPGQAMVVLVYADRPGRVRGVAQTINAFGTIVPHNWDLELQAGWNLVTSEQTDDRQTLRYRTGGLPEDLQWWTMAAR